MLYFNTKTMGIPADKGNHYNTRLVQIKPSTRQLIQLYGSYQ